MLQIPEENFERVMAGLINMDLGVPAEGVASAALHLLREDRLRREEEAQEGLKDQPSSVTRTTRKRPRWWAYPKTLRERDLRPRHPAPFNAISTAKRGRAGGAGGGPANPPANHIPKPVPRREIGVQVGPALLPVNPSWYELEQGLVEARAIDLAARQRRTEAFEAFERYVETCPRPHPSAAYWQRLVVAKREENAHVLAWKAERRARLQRQQEEDEERARRHLEMELEATLQAARARWEEARRADEKAAAGLGIVEE